jgi:hypothetical protein
MKKMISLIPILLLMACSETPEVPTTEIGTDVTPQKQLEADAKSIEQAADEAVKLIEAEAKSEIDAKTNADAE